MKVNHLFIFSISSVYANTSFWYFLCPFVCSKILWLSEDCRTISNLRFNRREFAVNWWLLICPFWLHFWRCRRIAFHREKYRWPNKGRLFPTTIKAFCSFWGSDNRPSALQCSSYRTTNHEFRLICSEESLPFGPVRRGSAESSALYVPFAPTPLKRSERSMAQPLTCSENGSPVPRYFFWLWWRNLLFRMLDWFLLLCRLHNFLTILWVGPKLLSFRWEYFSSLGTHWRCKMSIRVGRVTHFRLLILVFSSLFPHRFYRDDIQVTPFPLFIFFMCLCL